MAKAVVPRGETPIDLRRYRCPSCGGVVQVLPGFLARHLWRTQRRWRARLLRSALLLLLVLGALRLPALTDRLDRYPRSRA